MRLLPRSPRAERPDPIQAVTVAELFEQEVRQRRGRLADRETRMRVPLDEDGGAPEPPASDREKRAREAGSQDRDVEITLHGADPPQAAQETGGRTVWERFMVRRRLSRPLAQESHLENRETSQRSASTRPRARRRPKAWAASSAARSGGENSPRRISSSIAPFPA